jgi:hypothetical protein
MTVEPSRIKIRYISIVGKKRKRLQIFHNFYEKLKNGLNAFTVAFKPFFL